MFGHACVYVAPFILILRFKKESSCRTLWSVVLTCDYGKDSMVVNEQFDGIINLGSNSPGFWEVETNDGPLLTRLVDWYEGDIAEISDNAFIKGKKAQRYADSLSKIVTRFF